jgi:hypothetical protein
VQRVELWAKRRTDPRPPGRQPFWSFCSSKKDLFNLIGLRRPSSKKSGAWYNHMISAHGHDEELIAFNHQFFITSASNKTVI